MALVIDIVRHAEAAPSAAGGDSQRPLTARGRAMVQALAADLVARGWTPDRMFSSPYLRARQTAELLVVHGAPEREAATLECLAPGADPADLFAELGVRGLASGHIVLVSHMPFVAELTRRLTGTALAYIPAMLCRIECDGAPAPGAGRVTFTRPGL
jgi:phosphohistidine phosphatase